MSATISDSKSANRTFVNGRLPDTNIADALERELDDVVSLRDRLERIEFKLDQLLVGKKEKDWYTTAEAALILNKAPFTIREWCRYGRVHAAKRECGRGTHSEWMIAREELARIESEGLLPPPSPPVRHVR